MKKEAFKTPRKLVLSGIAMSCLTIFGTVQLVSRTKQNTLSQFEKVLTDRSPASFRKTCVLFYEREEHPSLAKLKKQYQDHPEMIIVSVAKPTDIVKCVMDHNPEELQILAHSHKVSSRTTQLTYFYPLTEDETLRNYKKIVGDLKRQHKAILAQKNFSFCNTHPKAKIPCTPTQKKEMRLRSALARLQLLNRHDPTFRLIFGYKKGLVGQKHFENLYSLAKTSHLNLKKINIISQNSKRIIRSYGALVRLSDEQGIRLLKNPRKQIIALQGGRHFSSLTGGEHIVDQLQGIE